MKLHSLSFKIPLVTSIILSIFLIFLITIITSLSSKSLENMAKKVLDTAVNSYSDMLHLYFQEKNLVMDIYAQDVNIINFLKNPTAENKILAEESLKRFTREVTNTEIFYDYSIANFDATIYVDSLGGVLSNINYGRNSEDWKKFENTGYNFGGRDLVQPLFYNHMHPIYVIWKGIKDENGKVLGVLNSAINWGKFLDEYISKSRIGEVGTITIIDKNKNIIAHTDTNKIYIYESDIGADSGGATYERKRNTIRQKEDIFFQHILDTKSGSYDYEDDSGEKFLTSYKPIDNTAWYLVASSNKDIIFKDISKLLFITILVSIIILVFAILFLAFYSKAMLSPLNMLADEAARMADGYIILGTIDHKLERKDEVGALVGSFSKMKHSIREMLDVAENNINETKENIIQMSNGSSTLLSKTEENVADIASVASSTEEITSNIQQTTSNAIKINEMMNEAKGIVENAYTSIIETAETARLVSEVSSKIGNITKSIEDISMQTGLLALNASVEAARAGDQGKGFAVVASEVRNLAQTSSVSVKSIIDLINESNDKIKKSEQSSMESKKLFEEIRTKIEETSKIINEFSNALREQEIGINKINENMSHIENTTKANEEFIDSLNTLSESLKHNASGIEEAMSFFKFTK